jgi:hypothetical protein
MRYSFTKKKCIWHKEIMRKPDRKMLVKLNPDGFERGKEGDCNGENFTAGRPNENDVSQRFSN